LKNTAVVILNFNGKKHLEQFLPSVITHSQEADIVIIDNASTDDSVSFLKSVFPEIIIICLDKNHGFAGGYNEGLKQVGNLNLVLLNSDVEVTPNWLPPLISKLESNENIAAAQPKILDFNNKTHFEYAGAAGGFIDFLGFAYCRGRVFDTCEADLGQYDESSEIFWATGAAFAIKKKVFDQSGGFDARFFAHMEEIDLCWRLKNEGLEIYYEPTSLVYHVGGGTLNKENPFKTFLNYRNNLAMLFKNLPGSVLIPILFLRVVIDGISSVKFLKEGKFSSIWAIIRAHFAFYGMIPYLSEKRSKTFLAYKSLHSKSIVWQYFAQNRKTYPEL
jgi:GT2 family glycosyltransferase